jgi:hypothetical protein
MSLSKECRVQGDCALWPGPNESVDQIAAPKQTYPSMHKVSDLPTVRMEAGHKRGYGLGATTLALTGRGLLMEGHSVTSANGSGGSPPRRSAELPQTMDCFEQECALHRLHG